MGGERLGKIGVDELEDPVPNLDSYEGKLRLFVLYSL